MSEEHAAGVPRSGDDTPPQVSPETLDWRELGIPRDRLATLDNVIPASRVRRGEMREESARRLGMLLVACFGSSVLVVLVIEAAILFTSRTPDDAQKYTQALLPLLESLTNFAVGVFGPLLGFVLGYYFSKTQKDD